jgi:hypothetical protein
VCEIVGARGCTWVGVGVLLVSRSHACVARSVRCARDIAQSDMVPCRSRALKGAITSTRLHERVRSACEKPGGFCW